MAALPVVAPLLAAAGHPGLARPIYWGFSFLCHQRPDRSFFVFGHKMACCERCAAVYAAFFAWTLVYAGLRGHLRPLSRTGVILFSLPMFVDGTTQLIGLRQSNWQLRVVTGTLFALGAAWLVLPHLEVGFAELRQPLERRLRSEASTP